MKSSMSLTGVKYGRQCKFGGLALIERFQMSSITIGDRCIFNSSSSFNFRGLNHRCILQTGSSKAKIVIGDDCGFSGCSIVADNEIVIGNNVVVGANTTIGDRDGHQDIYDATPTPIHIEDNVWLGMNVTILKGVKIGKNSIVGAGSIVTKNIPENEIWAGVPARFIKKRY